MRAGRRGKGSPVERRLWIAILCGGGILAVVVGLRQSLGLLLPPISAELGLGRETFALGIGLMNLVWGLGAPFAGALADRHEGAQEVDVEARERGHASRYMIIRIKTIRLCDLLRLPTLT